MTFDPYVLIKYHLYLLQLENYELVRFWKLLYQKGWFRPKQLRKDIVWTGKAKVLFIFSEILILVLAVWLLAQGLRMPFAYFWQKALSFLVIVYLLDFFTPIFLSVVVILLWPFDWLVKKIIVLRAKAKIKKLSSIKIIGIAGSYGKTTMKEVLNSVLGIKYNVLCTPESVNTPVGIARWILRNFSSSRNPRPPRHSAGHPLPQGEGNIEIAIIEMGEHYRGDIKDICDITKPDIAVVTGINESHLERMKRMDVVVETIFELVSNAKAGAIVLLNGDDKLVEENYKKFVWPDNKVERFKIPSFAEASAGKEDLRFKIFNPDQLLWEAEADGIGKFEINLLGEYALANADAAIKIGKELGMTPEEIKKGIQKIKPIEHRLQPIKSTGDVLVIDDSYNGNPEGVRQAIDVLKRFSNRRKIYITPGLVEMGKSAPEIHRQIGKQLSEVADVVILIKNSVTPFIEEGIGNQSKIVWFDSAQEAHAALKDILKPNDVILFQNDWGDQYW